MPLLPDVLKSWPPGGWQFYEPATNWHAPAPLQFTFEQQVNNIVAMRKANPRFALPADYLAVARELETYTEARIDYHPKYVAAADTGQKKTLPTSSLHLSQEPPPAAEGGVKLDPDALLDWFGAGGAAVPLALAETRASICAACPKNSSSPACPASDRSSWRRWVIGAVAATLRGYLSLKNRMQLATTRDEQLGHCLACRCSLPLKVWVPISYIRENLKPDAAAKLREVPHCWVNNEP